MATQDMHSQDNILTDAYPQSIYELLIYDNKKLASKTEGPHIIMRRSLRDQQDKLDEKVGEEEPALPAGSVQDIQEEAVRTEQGEEITQDAGESNDIVGAEAISSYIASLSHHVESDVLRVVDAISDLERNSEEPELDTATPSAGIADEMHNEVELDQTSEKIEEEGKVCLIEAVKEQDMQEDQPAKEEHKEKKKGFDISDIFKSLKGTRKDNNSKSYSYTKKVEYEDK